MTDNGVTPNDLLNRLYFHTCEVMFAHQQRLRARVYSQPTPDDDDIGEFIAFSAVWFASLYVVIEGWRELKLTDSEIDTLLESEHVDSLRVFRNATFHFQSHDRKHQQWFDDARWNWAQRLMLAYRRYFEETNNGR